MSDKTIKELFSAKRYNELVIYYKQKTMSNVSFDGWDYIRVSAAYRHIEKYDKSLETCKICKAKFVDFVEINNTYCWNLYNLYIKNPDINDEEFFRVSEEIINLTKQEDTKSPYTRTIFEVLKRLTKNNTHYDRVILWTSYLNPYLLSDEEKEVKIDGKKKYIASEKERWYSERTRALSKLKMDEDCIALCEEAINTLEKFHHDNDIWLRARVASSKYNLGFLQEAIKILNYLIIRNEHWNLRYILGEIYKTNKEYDKALASYCEGALSTMGELKHKINLINSIGEVLSIQGKFKESLEHYLLVSKIREKEGWSADKKVIDKCRHLKNQGIIIDEALLYKNTKNVWESVYIQSLEHMQGSIAKISGNGKTGFILGDNRTSYFFKAKNICSNNLITNTRVSFRVKRSFDRTQNKEAPEAIYIKTI